MLNWEKTVHAQIEMSIVKEKSCRDKNSNYQSFSNEKADYLK